MQRPKKINVDTKIIEKLATQSNTRYVVRGKKKPYRIFTVAIFSILNQIYLTLLIQSIIVYIFRFVLNKAEKIALISKLSPADHTAEMLSQVNSESADDCVLNDATDVKRDFKEFHAKCAQSEPGIVETSIISQQNR